MATDGAGYILTGPDLLVDGRRRPEWPLGRDPLALEASTPGVFVAGDARHGSTKRVAGAVGEGAMATALVHRRLAELDGISLVKGAPRPRNSIERDGLDEGRCADDRHVGACLTSLVPSSSFSWRSPAG